MMARFYGKVGFITTEEKRPGIWEDSEIEISYFGDVIKTNSKWQQGASINDDITLDVEISIMADPFAYQHFSEMRYVEYMGTKWKINSVVPDRPRISLHLGGIWNGQ